ncbi:Uncharacterised protein [Vibrio cholerae]|nr:Uncharacterised protein [Vibrio cholerae]CSE09118.1 Uncharacterised protein [Vibrio cholerae]CSI96690.1 Uncharacterised protein [Vibrio cholerae]
MVAVSPCTKTTSGCSLLNTCCIPSKILLVTPLSVCPGSMMLRSKSGVIENSSNT